MAACGRRHVRDASRCVLVEVGARQRGGVRVHLALEDVARVLRPRRRARRAVGAGEGAHPGGLPHLLHLLRHLRPLLRHLPDRLCHLLPDGLRHLLCDRLRHLLRHLAQLLLAHGLAHGLAQLLAQLLASITKVPVVGYTLVASAPFQATDVLSTVSSSKIHWVHIEAHRRYIPLAFCHASLPFTFSTGE